jgi:hypothetical protein
MRLILSAVVILISFHTLSAQGSIVLDQRQAVEIARKFVAAKEYVSKCDKKTIATSDFRAVEPDPVMAMVREINGKKVWSAQFYFVDHDQDKQIYVKDGQTYHFGREVLISADGRKVWMERDPIPILASVYGDCVGEQKQ